jgi:hypothetical protein
MMTLPTYICSKYAPAAGFMLVIFVYLSRAVEICLVSFGITKISELKPAAEYLNYIFYLQYLDNHLPKQDLLRQLFCHWK